MPFTVQRYFPDANTAGEGANNRKIVTAAPANNAATRASFGTNTTFRYILCKPNATNNVSATPAPAQDFGFNILKADMNAAANLPAKRRIPAGIWSFQGALTTLLVDGDLGNNYRVKIYVHRRNADASLTELFNVETAGFNLVANPTNWSVSSASQPQFLLDTDETLHIEVWLRGRGDTLVNREVNWVTGPTAGANTNWFDLPGNLRYNYPRSHTVAAAGVAALIKRNTKKAFAAAAAGAVAVVRKPKKVFAVAAAATSVFARRITARRSFAVATTGDVAVTKKSFRNLTVAGASGVAFVRRLVMGRLFSVSGSAAVAFVRQLTVRRSFSAANVSAAAFLRRLNSKRTFSVAGSGGVAFGRGLTLKRAFTVAGSSAAAKRLKSLRSFSVAGSGGVSVVRRLRTSRSFAVAGTGAAVFSRFVRNRRMFVVAGTAAVLLWLRIREDVLDRMEGGTTIVKKIIAIFDD